MKAGRHVFMLLRLSQCAATGQDALPDPHRMLDHLCQRMDPNGPAGPLSAPNDQDGARLWGRGLLLTHRASGRYPQAALLSHGLC